MIILRETDFCFPAFFFISFRLFRVFSGAGSIENPEKRTFYGSCGPNLLQATIDLPFIL
jgi:hypothetical protein